MNLIFMNSKNSMEECMHMEKCKKFVKKFKILRATWNEEFELPGESYSISDIKNILNK